MPLFWHIENYEFLRITEDAIPPLIFIKWSFFSEQNESTSDDFIMPLCMTLIEVLSPYK